MFLEEDLDVHSDKVKLYSKCAFQNTSPYRRSILVDVKSTVEMTRQEAYLARIDKEVKIRTRTTEQPSIYRVLERPLGPKWYF